MTERGFGLRSDALLPIEKGVSMSIFIVQHGKSLSKDQDPEKGLSPEGRLETERIAEVAGVYAVKVDTIAHSGKKRARQTAEILAAKISPEKGITTHSGMNPMDDVRAFAEQLAWDQKLMLVGHLPFLERLIGLIVAGDPEKTVFKLQNSGIVCLDQDPRSDKPVIYWALMPHIG